MALEVFHTLMRNGLLLRNWSISLASLAFHIHLIYVLPHRSWSIFELSLVQDNLKTCVLLLSNWSISLEVAHHHSHHQHQYLKNHFLLSHLSFCQKLLSCPMPTNMKMKHLGWNLYYVLTFAVTVDMLEIVCKLLKKLKIEFEFWSNSKKNLIVLLI